MEALAWVVGIGGTLYLLFRFPRQSLIFIGIVGAVGGGVGGYLYAKDRLAKHKAAKVTAEISYDLENCDAEYPLRIKIFNGSDDTVEKLHFAVEGHLEGYSDPLYDSGYASYSSDRIIPSGKGAAACWTLPKQAYGASEQRISSNPPETLVWTVQSLQPTFRNR